MPAAGAAAPAVLLVTSIRTCFSSQKLQYARIATVTARVNKNEGQLRIPKDVNELDPPSSVTVTIPITS
jgi:hypothetical protein